MPITAEDYEPLKGFFGWMLANASPFPMPPTPELHPLAVLARFETQSRATARRGLEMAIGDLLELTTVDPAEVHRIDDALRQNDLPTLSEVRARFWKRIRNVLKRGQVRSEAEYHALRNVVEAMPEKEAGRSLAILAEFEANVSERVAR
jgi:hypothetical protein